MRASLRIAFKIVFYVIVTLFILVLFLWGRSYIDNNLIYNRGKKPVLNETKGSDTITYNGVHYYDTHREQQFNIHKAVLAGYYAPFSKSTYHRWRVFCDLENPSLLYVDWYESIDDKATNISGRVFSSEFGNGVN